jgi:hypothetical protein
MAFAAIRDADEETVKMIKRISGTIGYDQPFRKMVCAILADSEFANMSKWVEKSELGARVAAAIKQRAEMVAFDERVSLLDVLRADPSIWRKTEDGEEFKFGENTIYVRPGTDSAGAFYALVEKTAQAVNHDLIRHPTLYARHLHFTPTNKIKFVDGKVKCMSSFDDFNAWFESVFSELVEESGKNPMKLLETYAKGSDITYEKLVAPLIDEVWKAYEEFDTVDEQMVGPMTFSATEVQTFIDHLQADRLVRAQDPALDYISKQFVARVPRNYFQADAKFAEPLFELSKSTCPETILLFIRGVDDSLPQLVLHLFPQATVHLHCSDQEVFLKYNAWAPLFKGKLTVHGDFHQDQMVAMMAQFPTAAIISDLIYEISRPVGNGKVATWGDPRNSFHQYWLLEHHKSERPFTVASILPTAFIEDEDTKEQMDMLEHIHTVRFKSYASTKPHSGEMIGVVSEQTKMLAERYDRGLYLMQRVNMIRQTAHEMEMMVPTTAIVHQLEEVERPHFQAVRHARLMRKSFVETPVASQRKNKLSEWMTKKVNSAPVDHVPDANKERKKSTFVLPKPVIGRKPDCELNESKHINKEYRRGSKESPRVESLPVPGPNGKVAFGGPSERSERKKKERKEDTEKDVRPKGGMGPKTTFAFNATLNQVQAIQDICKKRGTPRSEMLDIIRLYQQCHREMGVAFRSILAMSDKPMTYGQIVEQLTDMFEGQFDDPKLAAVYAVYLGRSACVYKNGKFSLNDATRLLIEIANHESSYDSDGVDFS